MKQSKQLKPISYLKTDAVEIIRTIGEEKNQLIITQNGEAKVVLMDIETYEETQELIALLKITALGKKQIEEGKYVYAKSVFKKIRGVDTGV